MAALTESASCSTGGSDSEDSTHNAKLNHPLGHDNNVQVVERHQRTLSASSTESFTYIADAPSAVFHAPSSTVVSRRSERGRPVVSFVNVAARFRDASRGRSRISSRVDQFLEESDDLTDVFRDIRSVVRQRHLASPSRVSGRARPSVRGESESAVYRIPFFSEIITVGGEDSRRTSSSRKSHYYRLKMCPKSSRSKGIKLQMDRLSVSALFDRNNTVFSSIFDVVLASGISLLGGILINRSLFYDIWLLAFAFLMAGTHFSLLKSVQPDASSPIHGFNWLVAYSRPAFFCILGVLVLIMDGSWWDHEAAKSSIGWNWNVYRFSSVSTPAILEAFRDLLIAVMLLLPVTFTLGLLPQVNTLMLHIFEQTEMLLLGGTACFSLLSAMIQLTKSLTVLGVLCTLANIAYLSNNSGTQTALFSVFVAFSISLSYLLSSML
ncbi:hypothetical protein AB6A40_008099 [Gnathostoma spinigerum]|uniref:Pecanex-like protein n=1 Tax=Gnathostoma spinigerum TaxID=75299 RepID=A0ABD6EYQ2_9BILA